MTNTPEIPTPAQEALYIPPEAPLLTLPLRGAVELDTQSAERVFDTPEAKVEAFFESNRNVFALVDTAWQTVKDCQEACKDFFIDFREQNQVIGSLARRTRRANLKYLQASVGPQRAFAQARYFGFTLLPNLLEPIRANRTLEECNDDLAAALVASYNEQSIAKSREHLGDDDESSALTKYLEQSSQKEEVLMHANAYARYRQDVALEKVIELLQDDQAVPVFAKRLTDLALTNEQQRDYPGIVELLATHMKQAEKRNVKSIMQEAIFRAKTQPHSCAEEFIMKMHERRQLPKELSAAVGVMELAAQTIEDHFSMKRTDFLALLAERVTDWPPEFQSELENFAAEKTAATWKNLKEALTPSIREGRLPVKPSDSFRGTLKRHRTTTVHADNRPTPKDRKVPKAGIFALGGQDLEAVMGIEREPISNFAVLRASGSGSEREWSLEKVGSIEALLDATNLRAYIEKHSADKSLEPLILAGLEHLTKHPKDPVHTKRYRGWATAYTLEGLAKEQKLRRFSPKRFPLPGVKKGVIAPHTRVIYDVIKVNDQPTLAVYGAFLRADLENLGRELPSANK